MGQNTPIRTTGQQWPKLEPAMDPQDARLVHGVLKVAGAGATISYPAGQIVCQKDDGSNEWAKIGTSGYTGPKRLIKYAVVVDENGKREYGSTFIVASDLVTPDQFEGSVAMYHKGYFKCQDLTGLTALNQPTVGRLVMGTYTSGIIELGTGQPDVSA